MVLLSMFLATWSVSVRPISGVRWMFVLFIRLKNSTQPISGVRRLAQNDLSAPARCVQVGRRFRLLKSSQIWTQRTQRFTHGTIFRERIEKYGGRAAVSSLEDLLTVTLERQIFFNLNLNLGDSRAAAWKTPRHPDLRQLSRARNLHRWDPRRLHHGSRRQDKGAFLCHILFRCQTSADHLQAYDRLLFINGTDVRHCKISQASDLIKVIIIVLLIIVD